jgi:hypothetical protein
MPFATQIQERRVGRQLSVLRCTHNHSPEKFKLWEHLDQTKHKRFKLGQTSTDDDDRSGQISTSITPENVAKVWDLILQDHRLTIQDLSNTLGLSYGTNFVRRTEHEDCGEVCATNAAK